MEVREFIALQRVGGGCRVPDAEPLAYSLCSVSAVYAAFPPCSPHIVLRAVRLFVLTVGVAGKSGFANRELSPANGISVTRWVLETPL